jgi:hypothetical protein
MKRTIHDPAKPIGDVTIVEDFLPPPEQLVPKQATILATKKRVPEKEAAPKKDLASFDRLFAMDLDTLKRIAKIYYNATLNSSVDDSRREPPPKSRRRRGKKGKS